MKLLFVALFLCVVAVHCGDFPRDGTWEEKAAFIKERLTTKLATLTTEERHASITAGVKYLKGEGPKPEHLSALGEQIVGMLTPEQKQQLVAFLETHDH